MQSVDRTRLALSGKDFPRGRQPYKKIWTASAITLTAGRSPKLDPKLYKNGGFEHDRLVFIQSLHMPRPINLEYLGIYMY